MSLLSGILKEADEKFPKSEGVQNVALNLPVKITEFIDSNNIRGIRLDNKEEVTVSLGKFEKKEGSKYDRPDFDFLRNRGSKKSIREGAVVQCESSYLGDDGIYSARWITVVSYHDKDITTPFVTKTRVFIGEKRGGGHYVELKTLFPQKQVTLDSLEQFNEVALQALKPTGEGVRPVAVIYANDGVDKVTFDLLPRLVEVEDSFSGAKYKTVDPNPQNSIDEFLGGKFGTILKSSLEHSNVTVKIMLGRVVYLGNDTRDNFLEKEHRVNFTKKEFLNEENTTSYNRQSLGYKDVLVGLRNDEERKFVTHFMSVNPFEAPTREEDLF